MAETKTDASGKAKTNFGALVSGPRGMPGVKAAKNPDALAAWINYKRNSQKRK